MKVNNLKAVLPSFAEDSSIPELMAPYEKSAKALTEVRNAMVPEFAGQEKRQP
jgi:hypothetical protein